MKKWVAALCILAGITIGIGCCHIYLHRVTDSLAQTVAAAARDEHAGKTQQAKQELDAFNRDWDKNREIISTFIRHSELDLVNQSMEKLEPLSGGEDKAQFYAECETLEMQLKHLYDVERFTLGNVF